jgi:type II secretory pathway component GspD/PulD (secretin)
LQRANRRRAAHERPFARLPDLVLDEGVRLSDELLGLLDEELAHLPERYRIPIILCDLEGLSRRQAATQLGCPEGTVAGRLARARELLATRLAARGVVPSAGIVAVLLTQRPASAVDADRLAAIVKAASGGAVPTRVSSLVERVVVAMYLERMKLSGAVLLLCGLIAAAGMSLRGEANAGPEPAAPPEEKSAATAADRVVTVIPLRKLDAAETAAIIAETYRGKAVTAAPIPDERSLLLYADAKTTREIQDLLIKLGDSSGKTASLLKLDKTTECRDAARVLSEVFNGPRAAASGRITIVPVPDENAILLYATPADTLAIRSLMKALDSRPAAPMRSEKAAPESPKQYTFSFRNTAWGDVLEWYARESGLTNVSTVKPTGKVTIVPPNDRKLTFAEITDLINEALMVQKLILIRLNVSFYIHPADEKLDPSFVPRVERSELKQRGKSELVQVVIPVPSTAAEDLIPEIQKLLSPFGTATSVKGSVVVIDTVGNIIRIDELLRGLAHDERKQDTLSHACKYRDAPAVAEQLRTVLTKTNPDDAVAIGVDARRNVVMITGLPATLVKARQFIAEFDKKAQQDALKGVLGDFDGDGWPDIVIASEPELRKYSVPPGTAESVVKTLLAEQPGLRVLAIQALDEIWVMATAEEHLALMTKHKDSLNPPTRKTVTIPLVRSDANETVPLLKKLFQRHVRGPDIEAGAPGTRSIIVKGTANDIKQIREILAVIEGVNRMEK